MMAIAITGTMAGLCALVGLFVPQFLVAAFVLAAVTVWLGERENSGNRASDDR